MRRRDAATLTWHGPALMLFARSAFALVAQAMVAAFFALRSSPTPWQDSLPWLPVYGTLIDAGCLALLWRLTRAEGMRLFDLVGFDRSRLARDAAHRMVGTVTSRGPEAGDEFPVQAERRHPVADALLRAGCRRMDGDAPFRAPPGPQRAVRPDSRQWSSAW